MLFPIWKEDGRGDAGAGAEQALPPPPTPPPSLIMQPTATMATAAATTTTATVALTTTWDNATDRPTVSEGWGERGGQGCQRSCPLALTPDLLAPQAEPGPILDSYLLLMVVMALFVGGALAVLSGALLLCRRCWEAHRRLHRCAVPSPPPPWGTGTGQRESSPKSRCRHAGVLLKDSVQAPVSSGCCLLGALLGPQGRAANLGPQAHCALSLHSPEPQRKQRRPPPPTWTTVPTPPKVRLPSRPCPSLSTHTWPPHSRPPWAA